MLLEPSTYYLHGSIQGYIKEVEHSACEKGLIDPAACDVIGIQRFPFSCGSTAGCPGAGIFEVNWEPIGGQWRIHGGSLGSLGTPLELSGPLNKMYCVRKQATAQMKIAL